MMPLPGRICLLVLAMALTFGLLLERPRPFAVQPPSHLPGSAAELPRL